MIENVSHELKKYLQGKSFLAPLLGFDMIILYACVALYLLDMFIYFSAFISWLLTYVFLLGIILCLANLNYNALFIGLGAKAAFSLIHFLIDLIGSGYFSLYWLADAALFGFFAYQAYLKTVKK